MIKIINFFSIYCLKDVITTAITGKCDICFLHKRVITNSCYVVTFASLLGFEYFFYLESCNLSTFKYFSLLRFGIILYSHTTDFPSPTAHLEASYLAEKPDVCATELDKEKCYKGIFFFCIA